MGNPQVRDSRGRVTPQQYQSSIPRVRSSMSCQKDEHVQHQRPQKTNHSQQRFSCQYHRFFRKKKTFVIRSCDLIHLHQQSNDLCELPTPKQSWQKYLRPVEVWSQSESCCNNSICSADRLTSGCFSASKVVPTLLLKGWPLFVSEASNWLVFHAISSKFRWCGMVSYSDYTIVIVASENHLEYRYQQLTPSQEVASQVANSRM